MLLGLGILFYPLFFSWFTLRKGHTIKARVIAFSWLVVASFIALVVGVLNDRPPSVAGAPITEIQAIAPAQNIQTMVSSEDADGVTQEKMDLDFLKRLETYTVERVTILNKEKLASAGYPNVDVHYISEAIYIESDPMKLAVIRLQGEGVRQVFIAGIVDKEFKRVLCARASEDSIPLGSGPCSEKISDVFGVSLGSEVKI